MSSWMRLLTPSASALQNPCLKMLTMPVRWALNVRATFLTGSNLERIASTYHLWKKAYASLTSKQRLKVRHSSLRRHARAVFKVLSFSAPNRAACLSGRFSSPHSHSWRVCFRAVFSATVPITISRRRTSSTALLSIFIRWNGSNISSAFLQYRRTEFWYGCPMSMLTALIRAHASGPSHSQKPLRAASSRPSPT